MWKRLAIEGLAVVFSNGGEPWARKRTGEARDLHARFGEPIVERDFFLTGRVAVDESCTLAPARTPVSHRGLPCANRRIPRRAGNAVERVMIARDDDFPMQP